SFRSMFRSNLETDASPLFSSRRSSSVLASILTSSSSRVGIQLFLRLYDRDDLMRCRVPELGRGPVENGTDRPHQLPVVVGVSSLLSFFFAVPPPVIMFTSRSSTGSITERTPDS